MGLLLGLFMLAGLAALNRTVLAKKPLSKGVKATNRIAIVAWLMSCILSFAHLGDADTLQLPAALANLAATLMLIATLTITSIIRGFSSE